MVENYTLFFLNITPDYFSAAEKIFLGSAELHMKMDMHDKLIEVKIPHKMPRLLHYINTEIESIVE